MHVTEIVRFPVVSYIILTACAKSTVESMAKEIVAVANLGGILIELNHIFHDSVSVMHPEMFKGVLGISDSIERAKIGSKFIKEGSIGVLPCQRILQVWAEDVWFKPVEGGAREEGDGVVDFVGIHCKSSGSVIKVQLKGDNESLEFLQVGAIKGIRFLNLCRLEGQVGMSVLFPELSGSRLLDCPLFSVVWDAGVSRSGSSQYLSNMPVLWEVIWWRSTERIGRAIVVGFLGSEVGVAVGFPKGWLSSEGGWSKKFQILLGHGCCYIFHGEYWCFLFVAFGCFWGISMCSWHDLKKNLTQGAEFKYTVRDVPNR